MGGIVLNKIYGKIFFLEKYIERNLKIKFILMVVSVMPIIMIFTKNRSDENNNFYLYLLISIFSFCTSCLFLNKSLIKVLNYINMFFCFIFYTIIIFLPSLFSIIGLLINPIYSFFDVLLSLLPYMFIFFFLIFLSRYSTFKKYLSE